MTWDWRESQVIWGISASTIYAKLGVRDRIHAVRFVQDHAAVYPGPGDQ